MHASQAPPPAACNGAETKPTMRVLISLHRQSHAVHGHRARIARCLRDHRSASRSATPPWLQHLLARLGMLPRAAFGPP